MENLYTDTAIFFNIETNYDNINSRAENLGKILRKYEDESLRLIKSIRLHKKLKKIKIYVILFKAIDKYNPNTINALNKMKVEILIPKLNSIHEKDIASFYSGFWYIPLTGLLMENTKLKHFNDSYLLTRSGDIPNIPEKYFLKLDSDMVILKDILKNPIIESAKELNQVCTIYYDKDFGEDCKTRLEKYNIPNLSNTCLIYSTLDKSIYENWYNYLMVNDSGNDDLFEEVSFDIIHPYEKNQKLKNIQIGENYLCKKDLDKNELKNIYFYHGKLAENEETYSKIMELKFIGNDI
jgi:hypothetical protein